MVDYKIILLSGIAGTGKSYWACVIKHFLRGEKFAFVDLDEVRINNWGRGRALTDREHLFKNEITLIEVKKRFIIDRAEVVVLVATMLTEENHQKPFIEMIHATEEALRDIKNRPVKIKIHAFWFDCDEKTAYRRIAARQKDSAVSLSNVNNIKTWKRDRARFEPPGKFYPFIKIDTSDESIEKDKKRHESIFKFICNN